LLDRPAGQPTNQAASLLGQPSSIKSPSPPANGWRADQLKPLVGGEAINKRLFGRRKAATLKQKPPNVNCLSCCPVLANRKGLSRCQWLVAQARRRRPRRKRSLNALAQCGRQQPAATGCLRWSHQLTGLPVAK